MSTKTAQWEKVYAEKAPESVSWYQPRPALSLEMIADCAAGRLAPVSVIDVGGGDALLVDHLLDDGGYAVSVLDISAAALARAQGRLGPRADGVDWIASDILAWDAPADAFDVWHDRAAFHFLTEPADVARYVETSARAIRPGGYLVLGAFSTDGPTMCSGLPVSQYTPDALEKVMAPHFGKLRCVDYVHHTPWGATQALVFCIFQRTT